MPTSKPQPDGTLVKALARSHRWQRRLESGEYGTLAELAAAERISRSYVSRVLRLTLLSPDIVEQILNGRPTAPLARFLQPFPADWDKQSSPDLIEDTARQLERMAGRSNGVCTR